MGEDNENSMFFFRCTVVTLLLYTLYTCTYYIAIHVCVYITYYYTMCTVVGVFRVR